jgi:hypothetical protein
MIKTQIGNRSLLLEPSTSPLRDLASAMPVHKHQASPLAAVEVEVVAAEHVAMRLAVSEV